MKILAILALCLLLAPKALSQDKDVLEFKAEFEFPEQQDSIWWSRAVDNETKLVTLGWRNIQLVDLENARALESRPLKLPEFRTRFGFYMSRDWVISPDGRKMLIAGHRDAKVGSKHVAWIWDLQKGERLAVLDKGNDTIVAGEWSKNGKTLVTNVSRDYRSLKEISFWDGETFAHRFSASMPEINWWSVSDDGKRFMAALGRTSNPLFLRFKGDKIGSLNVWETDNGKMLQEAPVGLNTGTLHSFDKSDKVSISRDGKLLAFIRHYKSKDPDARLIVWELNGEIRQKYEIKMDPNIDSPRVSLSPDGKRLALVEGKVTRIYDAQTGEKRFELQGSDLPFAWLDDNRVLLFVRSRGKVVNVREYLEGIDIASGKILYQQELIFRNRDETESEDDKILGPTHGTVIIPHPDGKIFLTYIGDRIKIFDAQTGEYLQTIETSIWRAGWSGDGKALYVISAGRRRVSIWKWTGNWRPRRSQ
jgi:hypothetical protein